MIHQRRDERQMREPNLSSWNISTEISPMTASVKNALRYAPERAGNRAMSSETASRKRLKISLDNSKGGKHQSVHRQRRLWADVPLQVMNRFDGTRSSKKVTKQWSHQKDLRFCIFISLENLRERWARVLQIDITSAFCGTKLNLQRSDVRSHSFWISDSYVLLAHKTDFRSDHTF